MAAGMPFTSPVGPTCRHVIPNTDQFLPIYRISNGMVGGDADNATHKRSRCPSQCSVEQSGNRPGLTCLVMPSAIVLIGKFHRFCAAQSERDRFEMEIARGEIQSFAQ